MASANAEKQRPRKRQWRKSTQRLSRRLFCCSCLPGEERNPLQEQEGKINGSPQHPRLDQQGSGEKDAIQITVEDLGIINASFSLLEEDPPEAKPAITCTSEEDAEEEEEDPLLFASGTNSTGASGSLLTPPVINLIPPTPSDVADDDQFFDINSEESVAHTSGSDGSFAAGDQDSYEEKMDSVEASMEEFTLAENKDSADSAAEPEDGLNDQSGEEREAVPTKDGDKGKTKPGFLRSNYQVAPLPEYPQKRRFNTGINLLSFTEHNLECGMSSRYVTSPSLQDPDRQVAKSLGKLNTDEVCQWFTNIGLQKSLPFIREAKLCGADIASMDANTLDVLHITTLEDREQLLSAIYNELHPPTTITQRIDSLLESLGPNNIEMFTAKLVSMTKSKSSPHVSCLSMNRRSLKLRNGSQNGMIQRNSQLIEITINGSSKELSPEQQIGSLLSSTSENRQLELHLCKREKSSCAASENNAEVTSSDAQVNQQAKEERIKELNQQVDSLQNVILQVQELHHSLVAFCSELKSMDGDANVDGLGSAELKQRLELVKSQLNDKRQSLQALRDDINNPTAHKKKLPRITDNKEIFHHQQSNLQDLLQLESINKAAEREGETEKAREKSLAIGSLSQLVSMETPAMLLVVQENQNPDGHYGFTCDYREGSGLVVVKVDSSHLCVDDRLVEVNGVPVVNSTQEELTDILLQGPSAQIVVLRQPPPTLTSQQQSLLLQHMMDPDPMQTICPEKDMVTMKTPPVRKLMAI
ncbi:hypothetical protein GBF38_002109 [Nibea albiflora]|uniref:Uncharacterized protein n=1 Tax=Nibea albiflora TaxID=240163 RepID=A0ACB7ECZ7_NIBAL|nr:hypothetical protein GBF38_002109 [Nibea albiflora]